MSSPSHSASVASEKLRTLQWFGHHWWANADLLQSMLDAPHASEQHLPREIQRHNVAGVLPRELREIARAAREVEDVVVIGDGEALDQAAPPALVHAARHQAVHAVVAGRDAVEHVADGGGLLVRRGEGGGRHRRIIARYAFRHHVKPGITGWAQVNGYRGETRDLARMEARVEHDLWYVNNWTIWLDLRILFRTLLSGWIGRNVY